ncbi:helix-turn-helix domain-containing protein [Streptomyces sp. NPDC047028]|uniref:helix-turn-helix domain-containing protein n=1 Tax=Streptomyces sp. NPDC047028 TaxID=3155793 RepID=UPI0033D43D5C
MATHVEDFAQALRELKERSGRTYGSLATRMNVSTSTLHRYCHGAAVPTEFGPVERFGRLCGATREELTALHRRWLLADSVRREPGRPAPETPAEPEVQEPSATPEGALPDPAPAPQRSRRPGRTKAAVLSGVAALAVALPVGLHAGFGDDGGRPTAAHRQAVADVGAAETPSSARSAGATASGTPSPSPSAHASRKSGGSGTAPESGRAASKAPVKDGDGAPPVAVSVLSDNWDTQCGQWFALPQSPDKVPPPPSLQETNAWAAALGGIPGGHLRLQLTAQSLHGQPVVLHALYVRVVSSAPAPKQNGYTPGSGCGGGLTPASFAVDLDVPVPRAKPAPGLDVARKTPTSNFPYQISTHDPQVLDVDAHTSDRVVSWYLQLVWSCGDRQGTLRVDDHGRPFRTAGLKGDPAYFYDGSAWAKSDPVE